MRLRISLIALPVAVAAVLALVWWQSPPPDPVGPDHVVWLESGIRTSHLAVWPDGSRVYVAGSRWVIDIGRMAGYHLPEILIASAVCGVLVFLARNARGRSGTDEVCRRCCYPTRGLPADAVPCPECGTRLTAANRAFGLPVIHWRRLIYTAGSTALAIGVYTELAWMAWLRAAAPLVSIQSAWLHDHLPDALHEFAAPFEEEAPIEGWFETSGRWARRSGVSTSRVEDLVPVSVSRDGRYMVGLYYTARWGPYLIAQDMQWTEGCGNPGLLSNRITFDWRISGRSAAFGWTADGRLVRAEKKPDSPDPVCSRAIADPAEWDWDEIDLRTGALRRLSDAPADLRMYAPAPRLSGGVDVHEAFGGALAASCPSSSGSPPEAMAISWDGTWVAATECVRGHGTRLLLWRTKAE